MSIEKPQDQANPQDQEPSQEPVVQDTTDVKSLVAEAMKEASEGFKTELKGLNTKISTLSTEKSDLEEELKKANLDKLTGKEKDIEEKRLFEEAQKKFETDKTLFETKKIVDEALVSAGLPADFAKRINGDNEAAIIEDVKALSDHISKAINDGIDAGITKRLAGNGPESGITTDPSGIDAQIKTAQDNGQWAKVMDLKSQKQKLNE